MTGLFQAIEAKFNANPTLRLKGRKLYEGFDEQRVNITLPYTEVNAELTDTPSTFTSDVETWDLRFRYHAKDPKTTSAQGWVEAISAAFKDAYLRSGYFIAAGCRLVSANVPQLGDGNYHAAARFELVLQRRQCSPLTAGA